MFRNLVICSDGTGNTFKQSASNVSRLIQSLDLTDPETQLVFYDQGIGTNPKLVADVKAFHEEKGKNRTGLEILKPPRVYLFRRLATLAGLTAGYGLYANIREMYRALAKEHRPQDDGKTYRILFFGFSRGAFTVRALAGLLYRCGLPDRRFADDEKAFDTCFADAYSAYKPHCEDWSRIAKFRKEYQPCDIEIHFLGIWDTVKSYGGLLPRSLPHLRHNPIVRQVCHALALNERRSWFLPTSWGGIDSDSQNASTLRPDPRYRNQAVKEVWFKGCHSDIGGGDDEADTAKISFRWMLGEATRSGLLLDPSCESWIFQCNENCEPVVHPSFNLRWWLSDRLPRWELDNSTRPPGYPLKWQGKGIRCAERFRRNGNLYFHSTVGLAPGPGVAVEPSNLPLTKQEVLALDRGRGPRPAAAT